MKHIDEIKQLKYELGRYQKKVADDAKLIKSLKQQIEVYENGTKELNIATDAFAAQIAIKHGEKVYDDNEADRLIGYRLTLPHYNAIETHDKYSVSAKLDEETDTYIIGVMPIEEKEGANDIQREKESV